MSGTKLGLSLAGDFRPFLLASGKERGQKIFSFYFDSLMCKRSDLKSLKDVGHSFLKTYGYLVDPVDA